MGMSIGKSGGKPSGMAMEIQSAGYRPGVSLILFAKDLAWFWLERLLGSQQRKFSRFRWW